MKTFVTSNAYVSAAHELIPGGAHTYAKGDDQYPEGMAPVIERGAGCRVWDIDGNEYVEFGVCAAHDPAAIRQAVDSVADLMPAYERAMESGVDHVLRGRPVRPAIHARG